jgi:hypothetical protein
LERSPEFSGWAGCGKGSFAEHEVVTPVTRTFVRTTVVAITSESVTLDTVVGSSPAAIRREVFSNGTAERADDEPSRYRWLALCHFAHPRGEEEIEVAGRKIVCRRTEYGDVGSLPEISTAVMWCSKDVPGALCRATFEHVIKRREEPVTVNLLRFLKTTP